ncbi:MAG: SWIM zinc finger family protein [bacterium]
MSRRRWYPDFYDTYFYPPSRPREAKGGIKAQTKRGAFGESWWAKRWIQVLESFHIGARLGRGRSYARSGQVLSVDIEKGLVLSKVQGSRPTPYSIKINMKVLSNPDWEKLAAALSQQPLFAAKLAAGEMPQEIEKVFEDLGLSLFPSKYADLKTDCSCPDWSNPCKHIAAVFYLLGEEFDRDPFLLFTLRGMTREELLSRVTQSPAVSREPAGKIREPAIPPEPLPAAPALFWGGPEGIHPGIGEVHAPAVAAALPKRLGNFPFWRGSERFWETMGMVYQQATELGLRVTAGEWKSESPDTD